MEVMLPPFGVLIDAHGRELMTYATRLAGRGAEDVLQEALVRALRSYPRVRDASNLRAWLFRIVTTTAYDLRPRHEESLSSAPPERVTHDVIDDGAFDSLLERLPASARAAMTLRFREDLDYAQIAARLGCSETAARQRVSTGVRTLRRDLGWSG